MNEAVATRPVALRTALIWRDEVMDDLVAEVPQKITVGHKGKSTFTVPDVPPLATSQRTIKTLAGKPEA